jgi:septal ring factor EnvC (AmiA/AmiB activator)
MAIKSAPPEPDLPNIHKPLRTRPLWRLFGWGSAATIALAAVALTSQTEAGSKRLQLALAYASEPGRAIAQIPPRAAEAEAETKRLAAQVRELAADRERLTARIALLERNLEDMTGSIKKQSEQLAAALPHPNSRQSGRVRRGLWILGKSGSGGAFLIAMDSLCEGESRH